VWISQASIICAIHPQIPSHGDFFACSESIAAKLTIGNPNIVGEFVDLFSIDQPQQ
jgi:hypothetical protein